MRLKKPMLMTMVINIKRARGLIFGREGGVFSMQIQCNIKQMSGWLNDGVQMVLVSAGLAAILAWGVSPYTINGESMRPTLESGQVVLVNKLVYRWHAPQADEVVVLNSPYGVMAKRIVHTTADGDYWVEGDNKDFSTDSREYGAVKRGQIIGRVGSRLWPL